MGKISKAISAGLSMFQLRKATADASKVLDGETFYASNKDLKKGNMPNNTGWGKTLDPGTQVIVPKGYHPGTTTVAARSVNSNDVKNKVMTATVELQSGSTDVGADRYILGLTNIDMHHYPGDGSSDPGEMWYVGLTNYHTIGMASANGTRPSVTYTYIPV